MLSKFKAFQLSKEFYGECRRQQLLPYIYNQLVRASSSIALNLAEGSAKPTHPDQRRFYRMAYASLRECQAIIAIETIEGRQMNELSNRLGAMIYRLMTREAP